jgi:nicotinamide mononucleotide transporter
MSLIELAAVAFSFACVVLAARKKILSWPVGIVGVVAYLVVFYQARLYADMGLQVIFLGQSFYGWWLWKTRGAPDDDFSDVATLRARQWFLLAGGIAGATMGLGLLLGAYTNADLPFLDSFLAVTSLSANLLLARKVVESWILWCLVDVLYIGLFLHKELYLSSALYAVLLVIAALGLKQWHFGRKRTLSIAAAS